MPDAAVKTPWHLWPVGILAILFNAIGVYDFVMHMVQGTAYLASAGMTPAQIAHYQDMPVWMTLAWALGVFGAFIASLLLLFRKRLAFPVFMLSLAAFLVNLVYTYGLTKGGAVMGPPMAITNAVIAGLLLLFTGYAGAMTARRVLR